MRSVCVCPQELEKLVAHLQQELAQARPFAHVCVAPVDDGAAGGFGRHALSGSAVITPGQPPPNPWAKVFGLSSEDSQPGLPLGLNGLITHSVLFG